MNDRDESVHAARKIFYLTIAGIAAYVAVVFAWILI